jgi:hypothetical protein
MKAAYDAAKRIMDETMTQEDKELLREVQDADVVVVRGQYDRVQDVLRLMTLTRGQMLIVNCPGLMSHEGVSVIRNFVEQGGALFTTDWALRHILEPAFPGMVAYNERPTGDEVVRIEILDRSHPYLDGGFPPGADPVWWLEGSSYPIRVLDGARVRVLLRSSELASRYGESAVAVHCRVQEGDVMHMISHYYLQRTETRTARHTTSWKAYAADSGASELARLDPSQFARLNTAEVEAAYTALSFMKRFITSSKRRRKEDGR